MEVLTTAVSTLDTVAAAEKLRLAEAQRGTAKGREHENDTETLLGELVAVGGDGLDDVSTVAGINGTKKGDKVITPRGGVAIVTEDKCTTRMSEAKTRELLGDSMANRGAKLAMMIVDDESKVPGNQPFHFIDDDKVVVVAERLALRVVYALFRAKAIEMARVTAVAENAAIASTLGEIRHVIDDLRGAADRVRLLRTEHTKASNAIGQAGRYVDEITDAILAGITNMTRSIDALVDDTPAAA